MMTFVGIAYLAASAESPVAICDSPSCTTDATSAPSRVNTLPRAIARPPALDATCCEQSSHSSMRERSMKPHAVAEARLLRLRADPRHAVRITRDVEQRRIRGIGEHGAVERLIVRHRGDRLDPRVRDRRRRWRIEQRHRTYLPHFHRARHSQPRSMLGSEAIRHDEPLVELRRQSLGARHLRHSLVLEADRARAVRRERHGCQHDLAPALIAGHLSLHEAPAVAHAPHAVPDRNLRIAGKQEVDVDRVTRAVLHVRPAVASTWASSSPPKTRGRRYSMLRASKRSSPSDLASSASSSFWSGLDICARGSLTRGVEVKARAHGADDGTSG